MEFNEKLQQLRTGKNLTQEQLAEQLYVSRTAISKWESGKGYPNIESLKCISKFFSVTIDELLSGEELITLAETENRSNLKKIYSFIYGILDMMAVTFILLPLYGNLVDGYTNSVNLLSFTDTTPIYLCVCCYENKRICRPDDWLCRDCHGKCRTFKSRMGSVVSVDSHLFLGAG